jgi:hypothetical protein
MVLTIISWIVSVLALSVAALSIYVSNSLCEEVDELKLGQRKYSTDLFELTNKVWDLEIAERARKPAAKKRKKA